MGLAARMAFFEMKLVNDQREFGQCFCNFAEGATLPCSNESLKCAGTIIPNQGHVAFEHPTPNFTTAGF